MGIWQLTMGNLAQAWSCTTLLTLFHEHDHCVTGWCAKPGMSAPEQNLKHILLCKHIEYACQCNTAGKQELLSAVAVGTAHHKWSDLQGP